MAQLSANEREYLILALHQIDVMSDFANEWYPLPYTAAQVRREYILPWIDEIRKILGLDSGS